MKKGYETKKKKSQMSFEELNNDMAEFVNVFNEHRTYAPALFMTAVRAAALADVFLTDKALIRFTTKVLKDLRREPNITKWLKENQPKES